MELIVKGSKADKFSSAVIKANRDSIKLPSQVRSELIHIARVYEFIGVKTYSETMTIIANFMTETGHIIQAIWNGTPDKNCNIIWNLSIQSKLNAKEI